MSRVIFSATNTTGFARIFILRSWFDPDTVPGLRGI
jgi:hypothetical protein